MQMILRVASSSEVEGQSAYPKTDEKKGSVRRIQLDKSLHKPSI